MDVSSACLCQVLSVPELLCCCLLQGIKVVVQCCAGALHPWGGWGNAPIQVVGSQVHCTHSCHFSLLTCMCSAWARKGSFRSVRPLSPLLLLQSTVQVTDQGKPGVLMVGTHVDAPQVPLPCYVPQPKAQVCRFICHKAHDFQGSVHKGE